jgi:hypothetical protein
MHPWLGLPADRALSAIAIIKQWQGERPGRLANSATRLEAVTLSLTSPLCVRKPVSTNCLASRRDDYGGLLRGTKSGSRHRG